MGSCVYLLDKYSHRTMPVKEVSDGDLQKELTNAGDQLVLIDFFATWCGPCRQIAPTIEKLSQSHSNVVFLKVDVDECQTEAKGFDISAMPTFVFVRHSKELERIRGADADAIESTLAKYSKGTTAFSGEGHSMLDSNSTTKNLATPVDQSDHVRLEQAALDHFGEENEGGTITTLRFRFPDLVKPVNIRLSSYHTLSDVRHLICETIESFQTTPFEFLELPSRKIDVEDENQTIAEAKLTNAVLIVKKM